MSSLAVVGDPISHSKSPLLHLAAYGALGLDWSYEAIRIPASGLGDFVSELDSAWRGLSVTMPHKSEAFDISASHDAHAMYTGAVNTLSFSYQGSNRVVRGYNTDVFGITSALNALGEFDTDRATLVGGGATALSALVALEELGFRNVSVALRDLSKAVALQSLASRLEVNLTVGSIDELSQIVPADVVICTVPGSAPIDFSRIPSRDSSLLLDVAYDVWPSPRAQQWTARGGRTVSGLSMLAFQAIKQVRIFTAESPDVALPDEKSVSAAMFASVGLDSRGL